MRIGLSYDMKAEVPTPTGGPEDALEEYDTAETVGIIEEALQQGGNTVIRLGGGVAFLQAALRTPLDLVFNIAEGRGHYRSREAHVPSVLEMLDLPYSGADPQCLAVCLDKPLAKTIVAAAGVATPQWKFVGSQQELEQIAWEAFPFPAFVKPAFEGSSKGVRLASVVDNPSELRRVAGWQLEQYHQPVMVEQYIEGQEITVGILGNTPPRVLGIMRILPKRSFDRFVYSLEVKRDWKNLVEYECPAQLDGILLEKIEKSSILAFQALGCRDFGRVDFRLDTEGTPYFLEINPLAGLGTYSDLVLMAIKLGWTHQELIREIFTAALVRYPHLLADRPADWETTSSMVPDTVASSRQPTRPGSRV
ncbi:MAG: hypothetical protein JW797_07885 [Bradymonadales bacterium]|nr:hypothetical protein [Bradymonadales bacterium]